MDPAALESWVEESTGNKGVKRPEISKITLM